MTGEIPATHMNCNTINARERDAVPNRFVLAGFLLLAAFAMFSRPTAADASGGHEHGTNLAVYIVWETNRVGLYYPVPANTTCVLQYLPLTSTNNSGASLLNAPWVNLPGAQALRFPFATDWKMNDFSVTNRHPTNLGRIYRLKVT